MSTLDNSDHSIRLAEDIRGYLESNNLNAHLPAISYEMLALQLIDCNEQESSFRALLSGDINAEYCDPNSADFDPIKAIISLKETTYDEACWLSFLLIYTDDSEESDWAFMRKLYRAEGLGLDTALTWEVVNDAPHLLNERLDSLVSVLAQSHPKPKFGHHRAYESLKHLPIVFTSYIGFIGEQGGHEAVFKSNFNSVNKTDNFKALYEQIRQNIYRFGRLSTFEYLCLLGKVGLAEVAPDSCYIAEASGPKRGARLLFGILGNEKLDNHAVGLADHLNVGYQEMEAALCHWQKSPNRLIRHR